MIVVGMGWRRAALVEPALELLARSVGMAGGQAPDFIAVPDFKAGDDMPHVLARAWGAGVLWIGRAQLQQVQSACPTASLTVLGHVGLASVAEACALAGAGEGAHLCLPRQILCGVTCAVARGDRT